MKTMKEYIREYVIGHNKTVTSQEIINYILEEKKIKTTKKSINMSLRRVLNEVGGELKPYGIITEIRNYVIAHNNTVTSQEVINYILEEKKINTTKQTINILLRRVLNEVRGELKPYGIRAEIHNYVIAHNNAVTSQEVIDYILEEKKIKTSEESIRSTLSYVLNEVGGSCIRNNCN